MSLPKLFIITTLSLFLWTCGGSDTNKNNFSIATNAEKNSIQLGKILELSLKNPKNLTIQSVSYHMNGKDISESFVVDSKLGEQTIIAKIKYDDTSEEVSTSVIIMNNEAPKIYSYKIINEYPHDINSYTQGLEFHNGELYESTGQYGRSKLRKLDYKTAEVLKNVNLTNQYFGEGLTVLNGKLYQLTWQENTGFIYDVNTLEKTGTFKYGKSKEGWGLCNDGTALYKSDGTDKIWTLDASNFTEQGFIQVYTNHGKIASLNELEWINGKIYANIYQRNGVAIINPKNGAVEGVIDFSPLKEKVTQHPKLDVLNGIAFNKETNTIFVTGKEWDKLFEVEVLNRNKMQTFEKHIVVSQEDLDNLNHVNNVRYVQWVQDVAEEHWTAKLLAKIRDNYFWILLKHHIEYKNPAILGDVLKLVTYVPKSEGVTTIRMVEIYDQNTDKLLVSSETTWCFINAQTKRPARIPQEIVDLFN